MTSVRPPLPWIVVAALGCFLASVTTGTDPLIAFEAAGTLAVCLWGAIALTLVHRSTALARAASAASREAHVAGLACRVIEDSRCRAFAAGSVRPTVYVTTGAIDSLDERELRAVLLHEAHHARTRAPLRAALVDAWLALARPVPPFRRRLIARLAAIEIAADSYAIQMGATRRQLASALVKFAPASTGVNYSGQADARVSALLGSPGSQIPARPVEWIPLLIVLALGVGCQLAGTATPV